MNFSKDLEERLPKTKLTLLCNYQPILDYVKDADHVLYQTLVETLIPEVLRPIPGKFKAFGIAYCTCSDGHNLQLIFLSQNIFLGQHFAKLPLIIALQHRASLNHSTFKKSKLTYDTAMSAFQRDDFFYLGSLTSAIRNYAKCLENWLLGSLVDIPQKMVDLKVVHMFISNNI